MISLYNKNIPFKSLLHSIHLECSKPNEKTISNNIVLDNCLYYKTKGNTHHYTTYYLFNTVMPLLAKLLDLNFNSNDFSLYNYDEYSFHIPKKDFNVAVFSSDRDTLYGKSFLLRDVNRKYLDKCPGTKTQYQTLYTFMHRCSDIINLDNNTNRILLLNCDSMISPLIPILSFYFYEVIVLDNRTKNNSFKCLYTNKKITDYLCVLQTPNIKLNKENKNLI